MSQMPRTASERNVNKSQAIRDYKGANPSATAGGMREALGAVPKSGAESFLPHPRQEAIIGRTATAKIHNQHFCSTAASTITRAGRTILAVAFMMVAGLSTSSRANDRHLLPVPKEQDIKV